MARDWYYAQGDQKTGPITSKELRALAAGYCQMSWTGGPQAAGFLFTPSTKTTPLTTSDRSVDPFNVRHFFDADSISL
jgi:hypothetical protein